MKQKMTPFEFALWAALPMAQTSQIERRLTLILDPLKRRNLTRRALLLTAALGAVILIPLAMLRPTAKAQSLPQPRQTTDKGPVQLVSVINPAMPEKGGWNAQGEALSDPGSNWWRSNGVKDFSAKPGQRPLFFTFHLSPAMQKIPALYDVSGTTYDGITLTRMGQQLHQKRILQTTTIQSIQIRSRDDATIYGAAFPASLAQTNIRVGFALVSWTTALVIHYHFKHGSPTVIFSGGQYAGAIDLSDDKIKYSLPLKTPSDFYDIRFVAVDTQGHETLLPAIKTDTRGKREESTARQPPSLLGVKEIRVEARPLSWTEFKDVALQPVK